MKTQYFSKHAAWVFACSLLSLLCFNLVFAQSPSDDFITITPENVGQLELGYALPGVCGSYQKVGHLVQVLRKGVYDLFTGEKLFTLQSILGRFSDDEKYIWGNKGELLNLQSGDILPISGFSISDNGQYASADDGVYDIRTKKKLFSTSSRGEFSHDSLYLGVMADAIYEIKRGKAVYRLPNGFTFVVFSPDSHYVGIWGYGVYDLKNGKPVIKSSGAVPVFSPHDQYVSISNDGVYDLKTRRQLVSSSSSGHSTFSDDGKKVAIVNDGVYELPSGKKLFKIEGNKDFGAVFLNEPNILINSNDAVYDLNTNQKRYSIANLSSISPTENLITISEKGIIDLATGELKFQQTGGSYFSAEGKVVLAMLATGKDFTTSYCLIYGVKGNKWPYRSGLIDTSNVQTYDAPNGHKRRDPQTGLLTFNQRQIIFAQTADKKWLRVADGTWVKASEIKSISLPDGIPIENP